MRRITSIVAASIATVTMLAGCPSREVSKVDISQQKQDRKDIDVIVNRDVDILFVIDDSESMKDEQTSLAQNFPRFIQKLEAIQGGLPNVHIGVISSNMGAREGIPNCGAADSDEGKLQTFTNDPTLTQCADGSLNLDGTFISDIAPNEDDPNTRQRNYTGDLASVFSCMAVVGIDGCGFEMQLESMRAALTGDNNPGFLREDAFLAVIFITDEDDCSAHDPEMFNPNITAQDSALGPLDSFRCFEFGVQCTPDEPRVLGQKIECEPRKDSPYMYSVDEYVSFLKGLKSDPNKVIVAGVIGYDEVDPDEPLEVIKEMKQVGEVFSLVPACSLTDSAGMITSKATPAVRIRSFLEQFPERNTITTICKDDLSTALDLIGDLLAKVLDNPYCLTTDVFIREAANGLPPYDCQVSDVLFDEETALPHCNSTDSPTNKPCWYIRENMVGCEKVGEPYQEVVVERDVEPNSATKVVVRCSVY